MTNCSFTTRKGKVAFRTAPGKCHAKKKAPAKKAAPAKKKAAPAKRLLLRRPGLAGPLARGATCKCKCNVSVRSKNK